MNFLFLTPLSFKNPATLQTKNFFTITQVSNDLDLFIHIPHPRVFSLQFIEMTLKFDFIFLIFHMIKMQVEEKVTLRLHLFVI